MKLTQTSTFIPKMADMTGSRNTLPNRKLSSAQRLKRKWTCEYEGKLTSERIAELIP
jgi:hypothetical protein